MLQGIGGAFMIPGGLAIISAFFPAGERGQAIGTWSAVTTIVTLAGPVLGGFLANAGLWRGVFLINLPAGLAALVVLHFKVPESRGDNADGKIDWLGALLAALGLARLTDGVSQYWTTFFPGIAMLGIGMGITVAPLSTGVMNAVATDLAGTASGINNAVARTAGALAIAIVGAIALVVFANALQVRTSAIDLSSAARTALASQASQLGAAAVPPQTDPANAPAVANAIKLAFVDTFSFVVLVSATLSWLGALIGGLLVDSRTMPASRGLAATGE